MELHDNPLRRRWALTACYLLLGVGSIAFGSFIIAAAYLTVTSWCGATPSAEEGTVPEAPSYPIEDNTTTEVSVTPTPPLTDEEKINMQEEKLRSMVCEPKNAVVRIDHYLPYHDELADRAYFPTVVTVKRCLENNSFCGNPRLGLSTGHCQPDPKAIKLQPFTVYYYEGRKKMYEEVHVPEHTACMCPE